MGHGTWEKRARDLTRPVRWHSFRMLAMRSSFVERWEVSWACSGRIAAVQKPDAGIESS